MVEPAPDAPDLWEAAVEQAIAICDGDVRAALRAALVANSFWADEVERLFRLRKRKNFASSKGQCEAGPLAREISAGSETDMPGWPQESLTR